MNFPGYNAATPRPEEWCLIEWPVGEAEPTKFWLSTLPATTSGTSLVRHAMLRWRIERDDHEMKQEIGLGHYEGCGWRGFHHHATLCIAAYGFLITERAALPPSAEPGAPFLQAPGVPDDYRPRGAANPA
jgi:SRSO17 transposase